MRKSGFRLLVTAGRTNALRRMADGLLVFADLIADHAANGRTANGTQNATACYYRTRDPADAGTRHSAFLAPAHVVP